MSLNPYESPAAVSDSGAKKALPRRPRGVFLLSLLLIVSGFFLLAVPLQMRSMFPYEQEPILALLYVVLFPATAIAAGVGMMLGRRWGWWLGCFYFCVSTVRGSIRLYSLLTVFDVLGDSERTIVRSSFARFFFALLFTAYFFKDSMLTYFDIKQRSAYVSFGIIFACSIGAVALLFFASAF